MLNDKKIRVLLTGGGGAGNEALWRLLGQRYELHFGDADCSGIDPSIPRNRCHKLPWASDSCFTEEVTSICKRIGIDLLVPGVDEELLKLAQSRDRLKPTLLMLPDAVYVETMLDKLHMANELLKKGIRVPATHSLASGFGGIAFPCIVKPRKGRGSRGVRTVNEDEAHFVLRDLGALADEYVVQEKAEGTEYTVQMIANQSCSLAAVVPVKVGLKRGITIQAEVVADPRVIETCRAIHEAFPAAGCYNIQLMLTNNGTVLPFEINPRVSTTYCMTVALGIDPMEIFLQHGSYEDLQPVATGMQLRRHWSNHFSE